MRVTLCFRAQHPPSRVSNELVPFTSGGDALSYLLGPGASQCKKALARPVGPQPARHEWHGRSRKDQSQSTYEARPRRRFDYDRGSAGDAAMLRSRSQYLCHQANRIRTVCRRAPTAWIILCSDAGPRAKLVATSSGRHAIHDPVIRFGRDRGPQSAEDGRSPFWEGHAYCGPRSAWCGRRSRADSEDREGAQDRC